jgi:excisionase family DNA binding protein
MSYLTTTEVAKHLRLSKDTVLNLVANGEIPAVRSGKAKNSKILIKREPFEKKWGRVEPVS